MAKSDPARVASVRLALVAHCAELLDGLRRSAPGVLSATVATTDGLAVASTLSNRAEVDKLAAMSGSIAALASALTRETGHGEPGRVILESSRGHIVSLKVPSSDPDLVLTVVTDHSAVLGKLLWHCRATADGIAAQAGASAG
jgi:predicted regulator of Ras-like GTPase activity (Roadblock/LC7/MglB family)